MKCQKVKQEGKNLQKVKKRKSLVIMIQGKVVEGKGEARFTLTLIVIDDIQLIHLQIQILTTSEEDLADIEIEAEILIDHQEIAM